MRLTYEDLTGSSSGLLVPLKDAEKGTRWDDPISSFRVRKWESVNSSWRTFFVGPKQASIQHKARTHANKTANQQKHVCFHVCLDPVFFQLMIHLGFDAEIQRP